MKTFTKKILGKWAGVSRILSIGDPFILNDRFDQICFEVEFEFASNPSVFGFAIPPQCDDLSKVTDDHELIDKLTRHKAFAAFPCNNNNIRDALCGVNDKLSELETLRKMKQLAPFFVEYDKLVECFKNCSKQ